MVDRSRKIVSKKVDSLNFYTTLGGLLDQVSYLIDEYGEDASINEYTLPYDETIYQGGIFAKVEETDGEMAQRIRYEEFVEQDREERDAKEFARLKAKFGE